MTTETKRDTVETWVEKTNEIASSVGDVADLPTGNTTTVGAINTIHDSLGTLTDLETPDQSDLVTATNEAIANALVMTLAIGTTVN
jgi:hypothetical protein